MNWPAIISKATIAEVLMGVILFIRYFLHPVNCLSIYIPGNGQMCHSTLRGGAMPVLDAGRAHHDITRSNNLHGLSFLLRQADTGDHNQPLTGRMRVPAERAPGSKVT